METAWRIAQLVLGIGLAILVHEFGHFVVARLAGIRVLRFSIGLPPRLFGFRRGETEYVISTLPIGGYVRLAGDEWEDEDGRPRPLRRGDLMAAPPLTRIAVYLAGVCMNVILAYVLFVGCYAAGTTLRTYPAVLGPVERGTPAARAGLRAGDRIAGVNGRAVEHWHALEDALISAGVGASVRLSVERGGRTFEVPFTVTPGGGLEPAVEPVIGTVAPLSPARKAGLREGDRIVAIDGERISSWREVAPRIMAAGKRPIRLTVRRGGERIDVVLTPKLDPLVGRPLIGISADAPIRYERRFSAGEVFGGAALQVWLIAVDLPRALWLVLTGQAPLKDVLGGPVLIARIGLEKAREGLQDFVAFIAALNVQLMVVNLLPIPVLDGGMILITLVEVVRRRRISMRTYTQLVNAGAVALIALILYATVHDLLR